MGDEFGGTEQGPLDTESHYAVGKVFTVTEWGSLNSEKTRYQTLWFDALSGHGRAGWGRGSGGVASRERGAGVLCCGSGEGRSGSRGNRGTALPGPSSRRSVGPSNNDYKRTFSQYTTCNLLAYCLVTLLVYCQYTHHQTDYKTSISVYSVLYTVGILAHLHRPVYY